jgi:hypothetical protein
MIDQEKRNAICRRLLGGDAHAQVELASLYQAAGLPVFAGLIRALTRSQAQRHARVVLSGGPVVRSPEAIGRAARRVLRRSYRCTVCGISLVDAENGWDTCESRLAKQ